MKLAVAFLLSWAGILHGVVLSPKLIAPGISSFTPISPPGFKIKWEPVDDNRVTGYKIYIWERKDERTLIIENVNGTIKRTVVTRRPSVNFYQLPPEEPLVQQVGRRTTQFTFPNMKVGVMYEARVQAVSDDGDGEMSTPTSLTLGAPI